jgi:EAL and modified HD-GYP domain-containing signal transduction protein
MRSNPMTSALTEIRKDSRTARAMPSYPQIIKIMNRVREEAELVQIEDDLKADPVISYRLMTYINSAGMGFSHEIKSFRQAVTILGYHQLDRWLTTLLVTTNPHDGRSATGVNAIIRGRFMELIGKVHFGKAQVDELFVVGAFSLLDELFGESMETLLDPLTISRQMRDALIRRDGLCAAAAAGRGDRECRRAAHRDPAPGLGIDIIAIDAYNEGPVGGKVRPVT